MLLLLLLLLLPNGIYAYGDENGIEAGGCTAGITTSSIAVLPRGVQTIPTAEDGGKVESRAITLDEQV